MPFKVIATIRCPAGLDLSKLNRKLADGLRKLGLATVFRPLANCCSSTALISAPV